MQAFLYPLIHVDVLEALEGLDPGRFEAKIQGFLQPVLTLSLRRVYGQIASSVRQYRCGEHHERDTKEIPMNSGVRRFDTFSDAFDYCRERACPTRVWIKNDLYKLYPSGQVQLLESGPEAHPPMPLICGHRNPLLAGPGSLDAFGVLSAVNLAAGIVGGLRSLLAELDAASGNPAESYDVICAMERARVALRTWDGDTLAAHIKSDGWGYARQIPGHGPEQ